ncbi:alpha/beta hydrolase [Kribbella turkmenica]|uniref:Alpha/beta hydrolase n=1 Tax=Kribbella turkmenica TaxID=2530375 RepID=A0A4R4XCI2_9ACTN|nr:alpha/beta hydrolase [Kribbella turkmenica]TDD28129.1 alpha/beta hydrolase [Kribbella turkmenica]
MTTIWVVLPGLAETPEEFGRVVELLPGLDVRVIDPWCTPVTAGADELRRAAGLPADAEIGLVGHSIGGLAVLRWALTRPAEVSRVVLVDTSLTSETGWRWLYPGTRGNRAVRTVLRWLGRIGVPRVLGPVVRRLIVRTGSATNRDLLSKATVRERYGDARSWLLFWDELANSWALAAEVGTLATGLTASTTLLVATGGSSRFTARRWLAGQRRLADVLEGAVEVLPDSAHLVHLDRPDAIAAAVKA